MLRLAGVKLFAEWEKGSSLSLEALCGSLRSFLAGHFVRERRTPWLGNIENVQCLFGELRVF